MAYFTDVPIKEQRSVIAKFKLRLINLENSNVLGLDISMRRWIFWVSGVVHEQLDITSDLDLVCCDLFSS